MISAVIVAAGSSRRMGFDKLSAELSGQPVLARSIAAFEACENVSEIIVVASKERFDFIDQIRTGKVTRVIEGGAERHLSVWNGIQAANASCPLISVHDGARPLVTPEAIRRCADAALQYGAAALAHRVVDTLKRTAKGTNLVDGAVSRDDLWAMETPQIFKREILIDSYTRALSQSDIPTDEVSVVTSAGGKVFLVENWAPNIKITISGDLALAEALLSANTTNL